MFPYWKLNLLQDFLTNGLLFDGKKIKMARKPWKKQENPVGYTGEGKKEL